MSARKNVFAAKTTLLFAAALVGGCRSPVVTLSDVQDGNFPAEDSFVILMEADEWGQLTNGLEEISEGVSPGRGFLAIPLPGPPEVMVIPMCWPDERWDPRTGRCVPVEGEEENGEGPDPINDPRRCGPDFTLGDQLRCSGNCDQEEGTECAPRLIRRAPTVEIALLATAVLRDLRQTEEVAELRRRVGQVFTQPTLGERLPILLAQCACGPEGE